MTNGRDAFTEAFRKAICDFRFGTMEPLCKPITYVACENGIFEVRMNEIGTFARKVDGVEGMGRVAEGFHSALPKVPHKFFERIVAFFREVMRRHGNAEAYIQLFWDRQKQEYLLHPPKQFVLGTHVSFDRDTAMEARHLLVMEAHSHNVMSAFFSGTDNGDEKADRLFMVIGRLDQHTPAVLVRAGMRGEYFPLKAEDIFAPPLGDVPQSWMEQVSRPQVEMLPAPPLPLLPSDTGDIEAVGEVAEPQGVLFDPSQSPAQTNGNSGVTPGAMGNRNWWQRALHPKYEDQQ